MRISRDSNVEKNFEVVGDQVMINLSQNTSYCFFNYVSVLFQMNPTGWIAMFISTA
jgi:hypothetical protein